jgi:GTPase Era involved in 16S rRNA processing
MMQQKQWLSKLARLVYVNNQWATFDVVVVVVVLEAPMTKETVELLEQVRRNNRDKRDAPVIILLNKIDDPDNDEVKKMIEKRFFDFIIFLVVDFASLGRAA